MTKSDRLSLLIIGLVILIAFRKFFVDGLLPIPYNILVGWYFPYHLGGWEGYMPGIPFKGGLFAADVFRQMIPWKSLSLELINSGQLPLWNPYSFSGEPLLANIQTTVFYPLSLLFFLPINFDYAWSLYIILSVIFGSLGTYLFIKSLGFNHYPSLLCALAFSFSGHMISWLEWGVVTHSAIWLPWMLFSLNLWLKKHQPLATLLLIFSGFATLTGGYPQESAYALILTAAYFFFLLYSHSQKSKIFTKGIILATTILLLATPQLLPTYQLFGQSALKGDTSASLFARTQLSPRHALTLFAPNYYGSRINENYWADTFTTVDYTDANLFIGTPILIFTLLGLFTRKKSATHKFFLATATISFLIALDTPIADLLGSLHLPMISTGVAAGSLFLTMFSLITLSAYGFQYLSNTKTTKPLILITLLYFAIGLSLLAVPTSHRLVTLKAMIPSLATAAVVLAILYISKVKPKLSPTPLLTLPIIFLAAFEYLYHAHEILSFSPPQYSYPEHFFIEDVRDIAGNHRVAGLWEGDLSNNLHTKLKLASPEGYNPLHLKHYQLLAAASQTEGYNPDIARSDVDLDPDSPGRDRFLDLTSTKFILAKVTTPSNSWEEESLKYPPEKFNLIYQQQDFKLYQNLNSLDRVQLFADYQVIANTTDRLNYLYSPNFDPHSQLVLSQPINIDIPTSATGSATITDYQPNRVIINAKVTTGPALLLLTDSFYPSWQATIDGQPTPIFQANQSFRAVIVPEGNHTITYQIRWP